LKKTWFVVYDIYYKIDVNETPWIELSIDKFNCKKDANNFIEILKRDSERYKNIYRLKGLRKK